MSSSATSTGRPPPLPPRSRNLSRMSASATTGLPGEPIIDSPAPVVNKPAHILKDEPSNYRTDISARAAPDDAPSQAANGSRTAEQSGWLSSILLFNREEPIEVAELRKRVEEEEIKRYMTNFQKHVDYLRLPPKQPQPPKSGEPRRHPAPTDYRRKKPISTVNPTQSSHPETPAGVNPDLIEIKDKEDVDEEVDEVVGKKKGGEKVMVAVDEDDIDWFAYYLAKITYHISVPYPIPIPSPFPTSPEFTVARFKSASTRLYATSRAGPWEMLSVGLGGVVMWDQVDWTLKWMGIYLILMCTSTFLPFLLGTLLYILLKPRLSRHSAQELQERLLAGVKKQEEAERIKAEKKKSKSNKTVETSSESSSSSSEDENIDLLDKTKDLGEKLNKATTQATQKLKKKGKAKLEQSSGSTGSKIKLVGAWETFQKEHGAQIVLVLNDLADMHEKIINLFSWKRPEASTKAAVGMFVGMFITYFTPIWVFVKGAQLAIFVVMFFVIPIVARMPAYDPIAWLLGDSPTDAEHALELIRKHGLEGKVWKPAQPKTKPKPVKTKSKASISSIPGHGRTPSIITTEPEPSNADSVSIAASDETGRWMDVNEQESGKINRGHKWLETGRQYMQGERSLDLSFLKNEKDWDAVPTDVVAAKRMSLGGIGGGVVLRTKSREVPFSTDSLTYLAHHNGSPGTLFVSASGLRFAPFISGKKKDKDVSASPSKDLTDSTDAVPLEIDPSTIPPSEPVDDDGSVKIDGKEVRIPMAQVSGVGKTQKSTLGVTISSGLEIETLDSGKFAFPFVANRDEAFNRILAQSHQGLERA